MDIGPFRVQHARMAYDQQRLPQLLASLYRVTHELEAMFPGLPFAPDGRMIGSLGIALAAVHYGITLHPESKADHDGFVGARQVQIKATQGDTIAISSEAEHLIAILVKRDGTFEEYFNGPGSVVWSFVSSRPPPKSGHYQIRLSRLRALMKAAGIGPEQRIAPARRTQSSPPWKA